MTLPRVILTTLEDGTTPHLPLSELAKLALREILDEIFANHFMPASQSSWHAHPFQDGSLCLNCRTRKDHYPHLLIPDLLDRLPSAHVFTKIDLYSAYNLIQIAEGDEWKSASRIRYDSCEFQIMDYGLTNAACKYLLDLCIIVHLDDILIYSEILPSTRSTSAKLCALPREQLPAHQTPEMRAQRRHHRPPRIRYWP